MEKDQAGRTAETNGVTQGQLNSEIKAVERLLDNRFLEIKSSIDLIARSLDSTTRKISEDASRIERLTVGNFEKLDRKIDANASALTVESRANFRTTLWTIVGLFLTIIAVVIGILALVLQAFSSGSLVD